MRVKVHNIDNKLQTSKTNFILGFLLFEVSYMVLVGEHGVFVRLGDYFYKLLILKRTEP